jgi:outer membrane receptor protein involved in Fe transport
MPVGAGANPFPVPMRFAAVGSPSFVSEKLRAFEVGIRGRLGSATSYDVSIYSMDYTQLRAYEPAEALCSPSEIDVLQNPACLLAADSVITQIRFNNNATGEVRGLEASLDWDLSERWRLRTTYAYTDEEQRSAPPNITASLSTPRNQAAVRSEWSLGRTVALAAWLRYVDDIPSVGVEDYWQANLQVSWRANDEWQVAIGGTNLLADGRLEYRSELNDVALTEIERRVFVRAEWRF